MSPLPVAGEGCLSQNGVPLIELHNFNQQYRDKSIQSRYLLCTGAPQVDDRGFHEARSRHEPAWSIVQDLAIVQKVVLFKEDCEHDGRVDDHQSKCPNSG